MATQFDNQSFRKRTLVNLAVRYPNPQIGACLLAVEAYATLAGLTPTQIKALLALTNQNESDTNYGRARLVLSRIVPRMVRELKALLSDHGISGEGEIGTVKSEFRQELPRIQSCLNTGFTSSILNFCKVNQ